MDALDRIKQLDIRDLGGLTFPREHGNALQGKCPFPGHGPQTGKTPSFTFYPKNNTCFCWGCKRGGTAIDFWMHLHGIQDAAWAIKDLADRYHIPLELSPEQERQIRQEREREDVLEYAANFYQKQLEKAAPVIAHLTDDRGFTLETIQELRLGLASGQLLAAVRGDSSLADKGLNEQKFVDAGLIWEDPETKTRRDRWRDRVVFPIIQRGRVVQMSARDLPEKLKGRAASEKKYLILPAPITAMYLESGIQSELTCVFEGLPDTVTAHQWGLPATGQQGTHGMDRHAAKFKRCKRVICFFDVDANKAGQEGGRKAAKAIHLAMDGGGEVLIGQVPAPWNDVNDYAMAGKTRADFEQECVATARPLLEVLVEDLDGAPTPAAKEGLAKEIMRLLTVAGPITQENVLKALKDRMGVSMGAVRSMFTKAQAEQAEATASAQAKAGGEPDGDRVSFTSGREIVPAQDFHLDAPARAFTCTFLQYTRTISEQGKERKVKRWEPFLVTVTHGEALGVTIRPVLDVPMSPSERRRVPFEAAVRNRWRPEGIHPHGVERFAKGEITRVDGLALFQDILGMLRRYIWLPNPVDLEVVAVWIMMTYVYRLFGALGYLHLHGVRESGKSNLGSLIEELAHNAKQSAAQSQSVLFRSVEANCRTMVIDEAEKLMNPKPGTDEHQMMLIANSGYKAGIGVEISEPDPLNKGGWMPVSFDIYGPKVFASIAELHYVLASRCIHIPCLRATAEELAEAKIRDLSSNRHKEAPLIADIRDRLHVWALLHFQEIHRIYAEELADSEGLEHLRGREREMWMPLLAIATYLDNLRTGGDLVKEAELAEAGDLLSLRLVAAQKVKQANRQLVESDQSIELLILGAVYELITDEEAFVPIRRPDWGDGAMYPTKNLAEHISATLKDSGGFSETFRMTPSRLSNLLAKVGAIDSQDRQTVRTLNTRTRCLLLRAERIRSVIMRLGGTIQE